MTVATSIKIDERTKDLLERLQAEIKLETGRKVTQQELLDRIVRQQFESRDALVASFDEDFDGLNEAETEQWLSGTTASGDPVDEDNIDDVLYGGDSE